MEDRFCFNAVVSSYYYIDTPEEYKEFEPIFLLKNVDVFVTGEIGISYDKLFDTVKEQTSNLSEKEIGQIIQHFEDNSNSPECDYVTIKPDKVLQCTGLKDKNGVLIYEGDIVFYKIGSIKCRDVVKWSPERCGWVKGYQDLSTYKKYCEVIGNKYENPELLNNAT